jgi:glycosyltransferase involved in cell wall biosynthesis
MSTSAILVTQGDPSMLPLAIESLRAQEPADFEVVLVDSSTDEARSPAISSLADSLESRLPVVRVHAPAASLGAATSAGIRAADGDRVLLLRETGVLSPRCLAAHRGGDEVVISPRRALLSQWQPRIPGLTGPRAHSVIGKAAGKDFLEPGDVRSEEKLAALSYIDHVWERFEPLVKHYGPRLEGCPLGWLAGLGGYLSAPRRALFRAGLFAEGPFDFQIVDPEPFLALHHAGLRFRVAEDAVVYHQAAPFRSWPLCAFPMLERIARTRDPIDTWLLVRFLTDDDVLALAQIAASSEGPTRSTLRATVEEWLTLALADLRLCWRE